MSPLPPALDPTSTWDLAVIAMAYVLLLATSGFVVVRTISLVPSEDAETTERERDVGAIVGKCENLLTLTFIILGAYTALAVIFAAKGIIRKDDIEKNSLFYLAGTLVNFTYSVLVGGLVLILTSIQ